MRTTPKANANQTSPKSPSLLSRFATPFTSRKRNPSEFSIQSDEPYRQYSPGDTIRGSVNIKADKAINLTHLVVCLHGFAKVFSNAKSPGKTISRDGSLISSGAGKRGAEYFGNGFVSLFENEVTLCGEGRLNVGKYKFEFQLELPAGDLPSSIDFERGTITYMLTSTITKPTTISPTAQCHSKIRFIESIDIARLKPPKPRTVSLEAIHKKSRSRPPVKKAVVEGSVPLQQEESTGNAATPRPSDDPPQSPAPSEISSASATSGSSVSWQLRSTSSFGQANNETRRSSISTARGITASIELLRGGCLPGDILPVQIFVSHTKAVKSLQGVIITLYRLARVDTHPAIPIGPPQEGKKLEYEDYYPKSRTGLGGLSLSSAGSTRSFRQDLNQVFAPLIVDPRSLTASVRSSVKVPEDLFPTISSVPGQMISFKYYVEVVVDLRGKLAGQERVLSQLGIVNGAPGYGKGDPKVSGVDGSSGLVFPLASGFGCLDTSQIRRERSVVSWPFEIIVGTRDSERRRVKQNEEVRTSAVDRPSRPAIITHGSVGSVSQEVGVSAQGGLGPGQRESDIYEVETESFQDSPQYAEVAPITTIPAPEPEEVMDEKTRLRRAEERLLPSAPPGESFDPESVQASAPEALDQEDFVNRYRLHQPVSVGSSSSPETIVPSSSSRLRDENIYPQEPGPVSIRNNDDKAELAMRRLQMAASSPDEDETDSTPRSGAFPQPSAPTIDDDDQSNRLATQEPIRVALQQDHSAIKDAGESLPKYTK